MTLRPSAGFWSVGCTPLRSNRMRRSARSVCLSLALVCTAIRPTAALASPIVSTGDAAIAQSGATWELTAGGATLTVSAGPSRDFEIVRLATASSTAWTIGAVPDTTITVGGLPLPFGNRDAGFVFVSAAAYAAGMSLQFDAAFDLPKASLRLTRHYRIISGSPTFEVWTTYAARGAGPPLSNLNAVAARPIPTGTLHWLTGLQGDTADVRKTTPRSRSAADHAGKRRPFALGAHASRVGTVPCPGSRSTAPQDEFYAALMWSGAWSLTADRDRRRPRDHCRPGADDDSDQRPPVSTDRTRSSASRRRTAASRPRRCAPTSSTASAAGGRFTAARHLQHLVRLRHARSTTRRCAREMDRAAALGVELFVIDAGWYAGAGAAGPFDFDAGLGSVDARIRRDFQTASRRSRDYAHSLGHEVRPLGRARARQPLARSATAGVDEAWLATAGGSTAPDHAAQICLASAAGAAVGDGSPHRAASTRSSRTI